jgi:hypothetical protein
MDNIVFYAILILILALIVVTLAFSQSEQTSQLRAIYERLAQLKAKEQVETADSLRRDRSAYIDQLNVLEADVVTTKRQDLSDEEMLMIETARSMIKMYCDKLMQMNEWMGPPFDLDWADQFERFPVIKKIYMDKAMDRPENNALPTVPADHLLSPPSTSNN